MLSSKMVVVALAWLGTLALSFYLGSATSDPSAFGDRAGEGSLPEGGRPPAGTGGSKAATQAPAPRAADGGGNEPAAGGPRAERLDNLDRFLAGFADERTIEGALREASELSAEESLAIVRDLLLLPGYQPGRNELIPALLARVAVADPAAAIDLARQVEFYTIREDAIGEVLAVWARNDAAGAFAWVRQNREGAPTRVYYSRLRDVIDSQAAVDLGTALTLLGTLDETDGTDTWMKGRLYGEAIEAAVENGQIPLARQVVAALPDGPEKAAAVGDLVSSWVLQDPAAATAFLDSFPLDDPDFSRARVSMVRSWSDLDPAAAATYVAGLPAETPGLDHSLATVVERWTRYDLEGAASWLNGMPASETVDRAVTIFTNRASREDPASAMSWAESIVSESLRQRSMAQVAAQWRRSDPTALEAYLNNSDLAPEARDALLNAEDGRFRGGWGGGMGRGQ